MASIWDPGMRDHLVARAGHLRPDAVADEAPPCCTSRGANAGSPDQVETTMKWMIPMVFVAALGCGGKAEPAAPTGKPPGKVIDLTDSKEVERVAIESLQAIPVQVTWPSSSQ